MAKFDTLGRLTKSNTRPDDIDLSVHPRRAEVEMLQFLNIHGIANTNYLHEWNSYKHPKNTQASLLRLWKGGYIFKPTQQRSADNNNAAISVYELDKRGINYLQMRDMWVEPKHRSNWWVHDYMCSVITSSIHIAAKEAGWEYVPRHVILGIKDAPIWMEINEKKLIPDDLFALKSPEGYYTAFTVEAYRSTEAATSMNPDRKTYERTIRQYDEFIGDKEYKDHYGLKARLLNLNIFNTPVHEKKYLAEIEDDCSYVLTKFLPGFMSGWRPPKEVYRHLFTDPYSRKGKEQFFLNR